MAPVANGRRNGEWSKCSLDHLRGFARTLTQACFDRTADKHYKINVTQLPGALFTKLKLCQKTYPVFTDIRVHSESVNSRTCNIWCCSYSYGKCLQVPLMDGMECTRGHHCVKHKCIPKLAHQAPRTAPPTRFLTPLSTATTTERTTSTYGPRPTTVRRRTTINWRRWWYPSRSLRSSIAGQ
ncbi:hypothetical protein IscW_ISCW008759 [Ixodes scapularis]|uniref:Uncharacterized protein n=1 Tax=Ixodes scapularis TaxID=6945 RepID=B7PZG3_IXOSC|nr:hypothetical protein IscW_ISCW008759 [Ixodes scapularis]|eukprot:XP_002405248.1 hypothetical protein IscW_ISCW008759 [Ixodes scapularis]